MANYVNNRNMLRTRRFNSKTGRSRKSSTGQMSNDVYSRYSRSGRPVNTRMKKQYVTSGKDVTQFTRNKLFVTNTHNSVTNSRKSRMSSVPNYDIYSECPYGMLRSRNGGCYEPIEEFTVGRTR